MDFTFKVLSFTSLGIRFADVLHPLDAHASYLQGDAAGPAGHVDARAPTESTLALCLTFFEDGCIVVVISSGSAYTSKAEIKDPCGDRSS